MRKAEIKQRNAHYVKQAKVFVNQLQDGTLEEHKISNGFFLFLNLYIFKKNQR